MTSDHFKDPRRKLAQEFGISDTAQLMFDGFFVGDVCQGMAFHGDVVVDFSERAAEEIEKFTMPEDLSVDGNVTLLNYPLATLPDGLKVTGNLRVTGVKLERLPARLEVGRILDLTGVKERLSIPKDLVVGTCIET